MRPEQELKRAKATVRLFAAILIMLPFIAHFVSAAVGFYVFFLADVKLQAVLASLGQVVVGIPLYRRATGEGRWLDRTLTAAAVGGYLQGLGLALLGVVAYPIGAVHMAFALSSVALVWLSSRALSFGEH